MFSLDVFVICLEDVFGLFLLPSVDLSIHFETSLKRNRPRCHSVGARMAAGASKDRLCSSMAKVAWPQTLNWIGSKSEDFAVNGRQDSFATTPDDL